MNPNISQFVGKVGNRIGTVAREARDIPTAVGTIMTKYAFPKDVESGPSNKNLGNQIKEVGTAAFTGKKGTTSDINSRALGTGFLKGDSDPSYGYEKGSKRK
jgi:hypothetical protein